MKELIKAFLDILPSNKWSNITLLIVAIVLAALIAFTTSCCSVYSRSTFSTDSASVRNMHIQKTDSIHFYPFKK